MQFAPLLLLPFLTMAGSEPVTVRVQDTRGGPQIHVAGKPIPPRFFWGAMNSGMIAVKPEWRSHTFEFLPGDVDGTGTLHFRFAHEPGDIWLADLRIQDTTTSEDILPPGSFASPEAFAKRWHLWPVGPANTVGTVNVSDSGVHVSLKRPAHGNWPDFHLHSHTSLRFAVGRTYRCSFRAKATPEGHLCRTLQRRWGKLELHRRSTGLVPEPGRPCPRRWRQSGFLRRSQLLDTSRERHR